MFHLVLIRHGQTGCSVAGRFCGDHDARLTRVGREMAGYTATHPCLSGLDAVVSSPASRAVDTADRIAAGRGVPTVVDERLRELSFGEWEGRLPSEVDPVAHQRWVRDPALHRPPGGESGLAVMARAMACVGDLIRPEGTTALVTHKAPIRLIVAFFLGLAPSRYRAIGNVAVGSVSLLRLRSGRAELVAMGDVSHLPARWRLDPDRAGAATRRRIGEVPRIDCAGSGGRAGGPADPGIGYRVEGGGSGGFDTGGAGDRGLAGNR